MIIIAFFATVKKKLVSIFSSLALLAQLAGIQSTLLGTLHCNLWTCFATPEYIQQHNF